MLQVPSIETIQGPIGLRGVQDFSNIFKEKIFNYSIFSLIFFVFLLLLPF